MRKKKGKGIGTRSERGEKNEKGDVGGTGKKFGESRRLEKDKTENQNANPRPCIRRKGSVGERS